MAHPGGISLLSCFAYYTQCAIASYSGACSRRSTAKSEKDRLKSIAEGMIEDLRIHTPTTGEQYEVAKAAKELQECVERLQKQEEYNKQDEAETANRKLLSKPPPKAL
jgi:hypothetical protein